MAMQGNLQVMTVADLIQHNCQDRKTVRIVIEHNGDQGLLFLVQPESRGYRLKPK